MTRFVMMLFMSLLTRQGFNHNDTIPTIHDLKKFDIRQVPGLFGVSVYSFMCHHRYFFV